MSRKAWDYFGGAWARSLLGLDEAFATKHVFLYSVSHCLRGCPTESGCREKTGSTLRTWLPISSACKSESADGHGAAGASASPLIPVMEASHHWPHLVWVFLYPTGRPSTQRSICARLLKWRAAPVLSCLSRLPITEEVEFFGDAGITGCCPCRAGRDIRTM